MSRNQAPRHLADSFEENAFPAIEYDGALVTAPLIDRTIQSLSHNPERYMLFQSGELPEKIEHAIFAIDTTNGRLDIEAQITIGQIDVMPEVVATIHDSIRNIDDSRLKSYGLIKEFGEHSNAIVLQTDGGVLICVSAEYQENGSVRFLLKTHNFNKENPVEAPYIDDVDCVKAVKEFSSLWLITLREVEKAVSAVPNVSQLSLTMSPQKLDYEIEEAECKPAQDEPQTTKVLTEVAVIEDEDSEQEADEFEDERNEITFEDIGGNFKAKAELDKLAESILNPAILEKWGVRRPSGIILYGPEGNGKTSLVWAFANKIGAIVWEITADQILSRASGESEANIREIFVSANDTTALTVMFFDEIDAIIYDPERTNSGFDSVRRNVAGIFKQELEKISRDNPNIIVMATTNHLDDISPSIKRSGRFDKHIYIASPNDVDRKDIFAVKIAKVVSELTTPFFSPVDQGIDYEELSEKTAGRSGADITSIIDGLLYDKAMAELSRGFPEPITHFDILHAIDEKRQQ